MPVPTAEVERHVAGAGLDEAAGYEKVCRHTRSSVGDEVWFDRAVAFDDLWVFVGEIERGRRVFDDVRNAERLRRKNSSSATIAPRVSESRRNRSIEIRSRSRSCNRSSEMPWSTISWAD